MIRTIALASLAALSLSGISCDKHSFESTKKLHESYNSHGHGTTDTHEAKADTHAPNAGEKKH